MAGTSDPYSDDGVEYDRQEDEQPLDYRQEWNAVDGEDCVLKNFGTADQAGIGDQMDAHVGTHGNQTAQRVEAAN